MKNNIVKVKLWGQEVGSLYWDDHRKRSVFSYHPEFLKDGMDIAPLSASIKEPRNRLPIATLSLCWSVAAATGTFRPPTT